MNDYAQGTRERAKAILILRGVDQPKQVSGSVFVPSYSLHLETVGELPGRAYHPSA